MSNQKVKCPQCGSDTIYDTKNSYRPFCSERCKLIDLGQWADEKYAIAGETNDFTVNDTVNENQKLVEDSSENSDHPYFH